jgi:enhancing lycopene biosynthesis protein 2
VSFPKRDARKNLSEFATKGPDGALDPDLVRLVGQAYMLGPGPKAVGAGIEEAIRTLLAWL